MPTQPLKLTNVVFTRNRPLQLHAYLESMARFSPTDEMRTIVLYKPDQFESSYEEVFRHFPHVKVFRESNFYTDFMDIISAVDTPYVLFGVDDVVYFDYVPFSTIDETFNHYGEDMLGFSLRLGPEQTALDAEAGTQEEITINGKKTYIVYWTEGQTSATRYPFELEATIYPTKKVQTALTGTTNAGRIWRGLFLPGKPGEQLLSKIVRKKKLTKPFGFFYNPNTLESWTAKWCQRNPNKIGKFLAFGRICATSIPVNIVNTSADNWYDAEDDLSVQALNAYYQQGWRFDIEKLVHKKPESRYCGRTHFFLK